MRAGAVHYIHANKARNHWAARIVSKAMAIIGVTIVIVVCAYVPLLLLAAAVQFISTHVSIVAR